MSAKFIKLSTGHYINADRICVIADRAKVNIGKDAQTGSELRFGQGFMFYAPETPDQILELIRAAEVSQ